MVTDREVLNLLTVSEQHGILPWSTLIPSTVYCFIFSHQIKVIRTFILALFLKHTRGYLVIWGYCEILPLKFLKMYFSAVKQTVWYLEFCFLKQEKSILVNQI